MELDEIGLFRGNTCETKQKELVRLEVPSDSETGCPKCGKEKDRWVEEFWATMLSKEGLAKP